MFEAYSLFTRFRPGDYFWPSLRANKTNSVRVAKECPTFRDRRAQRPLKIPASRGTPTKYVPLHNNAFMWNILPSVKTTDDFRPLPGAVFFAWLIGTWTKGESILGSSSFFFFFSRAKHTAWRHDLILGRVLRRRDVLQRPVFTSLYFRIGQTLVVILDTQAGFYAGWKYIGFLWFEYIRVSIKSIYKIFKSYSSGYSATKSRTHGVCDDRA